MILSKMDVQRIEALGYTPNEFTVMDSGIIRLKNVHGRCYFYRDAGRRCKIYRQRPMGCRLYPVIYSIEEGITVDDECPMNSTATYVDLNRKGKQVMKLLSSVFQKPFEEEI